MLCKLVGIPVVLRQGGCQFTQLADVVFSMVGDPDWQKIKVDVIKPAQKKRMGM